MGKVLDQGSGDLMCCPDSISRQMCGLGKVTVNPGVSLCVSKMKGPVWVALMGHNILSSSVFPCLSMDTGINWMLKLDSL